MSPIDAEGSRYAALRRGGRVLHRLSWLVTLGFLMLGFGLFLDQAGALLSDAEFTWGERRVMGLTALITLGGCGLAGWVVGQLFKVVAEVLGVLADGAEASWRTGDLIEQHLVPTLGRIAMALEDGQAARKSDPSMTGASIRKDSEESLRAELSRARSAGRPLRVFALRDALTQHLRGQELHALDCELATWMLHLVEARIRAGNVDAEMAGWVDRAMDSLGTMPEAAPLRTALPALRRGAGLCQKCGRRVRGPEALCEACQARVMPAASKTNPRTAGNQDRP